MLKGRMQRFHPKNLLSIVLTILSWAAIGLLALILVRAFITGNG